MRDLIIWVITWYLIWGSFNYKVRWSLEQFRGKKYIGRGLFFLLSFVFVYFTFNKYTNSFAVQLVLATILANVVGLYLGFTKSFYNKFKKDRYFLAFQSFNVLFQQTMVVVAISMLQSFFGQDYKDYCFGIMFFVVHLPILFLPWAKLKGLYAIYSLFGGFIFSYLINNYQLGLVITFTLHYAMYVWSIYYIKDEEKI